MRAFLCLQKLVLTFVHEFEVRCTVLLIAKEKSLFPIQIDVLDICP